jgi:hypothetical protein
MVRRGEDSIRLALAPTEAAECLGCSRDFLNKHMSPELRWLGEAALSSSQ